MRRSALWMLLSGLFACGGQNGETTPEPTGGGEGAGGRTGAFDLARPCDAYVSHAMKCARAEAERSGWESGADEEAAFEEDVRRECRGWLEQGATAERLRDAVDGCADVPCGESAGLWYQCIVGRLGIEPAPLPPPDEPSAPVFERVPPRPIDASGTTCAIYTAWIMQCMTETADQPLPAEAADAMRDALQDSCTGLEAADPEDRFFHSSLEACRDVACGPGGADLLTCIATEFAERLTAAATENQPPPPPP